MVRSRTKGHGVCLFVFFFWSPARILRSFLSVIATRRFNRELLISDVSVVSLKTVTPQPNVYPCENTRELSSTTAIFLTTLHTSTIRLGRIHQRFCTVLPEIMVTMLHAGVTGIGQRHSHVLIYTIREAEEACKLSFNLLA
jgi:hypothetical protein